MSRRGPSLEAPTGSRRAPFVVLLAVLSLVGLALLLGRTQGGWLAFALVPALLLSLWIVGSVLSSLRR